MLTYIQATNQPQHVSLLYSVRSSQDIPFIETINQATSTNPQIRKIITITGEESNVPNGFQKGRVSEELIESLIPRSIRSTRFYICGPSPFIHSVEDILNKMSAHPRHVYSEDFVPSARVLWKQPVPFVAGTAVLAGSILAFSVITNAHDVSAFADKSFNRLNTIFHTTDLNAVFNEQRNKLLSNNYEAYTIPEIRKTLVPKQTTEQITVTEQGPTTKKIVTPSTPPTTRNTPPTNPTPSQPKPQASAPSPAPLPVVTPQPPQPRTAAS